MEFYKFNKSSGKKISKFDSDFIMSRILQTDKPANIGCIHLEENGVVGYHQAVTPQLLLVVSGEGSVRGEMDEYFYVGVGDAVFWNKGEWHETKSESGMTAIVIESEALEPASFMQKK
ncbi:cupin domain-containing protein [Planococcus beigongshangi]|uniref:cupin domain-containing protein n=1 Tax=Planococcus beigongshangi TaxID=2782536 RepID=UPI00193AE554|nr:cupin domain-containing protein [Planococcus beigongshangi]